MRLIMGSLLVLGILGMCAAQGQNKDTNFSAGPQYLITTPSPLFLRPIVTPSLSLQAAATSSTGESETYVGTEIAPTPSLPTHTDFSRIYWGEPPVSEIQISGSPAPRNLPMSIFDSGVTGSTYLQGLSSAGYGSEPGPAADYSKTHKGHASRIYTNRDVERLHSN